MKIRLLTYVILIITGVLCLIFGFKTTIPFQDVFGISLMILGALNIILTLINRKPK